MTGILFGSCACCNAGECPDVDGGENWATWIERYRPAPPDEAEDGLIIPYQWPGGAFQYPSVTGNLKIDPEWTDVLETPNPQFPDIHWPPGLVHVQSIFDQTIMVFRAENLTGQRCFRVVASVVDRNNVLAPDLQPSAGVPKNGVAFSFAVTNGVAVFSAARKLRSKVRSPAWLSHFIDTSPHVLLAGNVNAKPLEYICTLGVAITPVAVQIFVGSNSVDWNLPSTRYGVKVEFFRQGAL